MLVQAGVGAHASLWEFHLSSALRQGWFCCRVAIALKQSYIKCAWAIEKMLVKLYPDLFVFSRTSYHAARACIYCILYPWKLYIPLYCTTCPSVFFQTTSCSETCFILFIFFCHSGCCYFNLEVARLGSQSMQHLFVPQWITLHVCICLQWITLRKHTALSFSGFWSLWFNLVFACSCNWLPPMLCSVEVPTAGLVFLKLLARVAWEL